MSINHFYKKLAAVSLAIGLLIFGFQNCSPKGFKAGSVPDPLSSDVSKLSSASNFSTTNFSYARSSQEVTSPVTQDPASTPVAAAPQPTVAEPAQGIRMLYNGQVSQGPFFAAQTIGVQIYGFAENDTYICVDDLYGSTFYCEDSKYFSKLPSQLYGYKGFTYSNGQWLADFKGTTKFTSYRVTVKNSRGDTAVKIFRVDNTIDNLYPMSRQFINGNIKMSQYHKGDTVEIRVYGYSKDVLYCLQESLPGQYTYDVHSCGENDYVKLNDPAWSYVDGYWTAKISSSQLKLDYAYRYRFMDLNHGRAFVGGFIVIPSVETGFVNGP